MNQHFITALALHGILLGQPTEPVRQWQVMRETMQSLGFVKVDRALIYYRKDTLRDENGRTSWNAPSVTKMRKAGDCEDMAIFDYFNTKYAQEDMAAVVIGNTPKGLHAALFYAEPTSMIFKRKIVAPAATFKLSIKDRVNPDLAAYTTGYLEFFKPIYLISQDKMYVVQPMEGKNERI